MTNVWPGPSRWDDPEWARERILEQVGSTAQAAVESFGLTAEDLHREIDEALELEVKDLDLFAECREIEAALARDEEDASSWPAPFLPQRPHRELPRRRPGAAGAAGARSRRRHPRDRSAARR